MQSRHRAGSQRRCGPRLTAPQFTRIKSIADINSALHNSSAQGKPVMLDFYADRCTYCIGMEDYTFSAPVVQTALAGVTLLQADVTTNDSEDLSLLNHFNLFAPPAILFFDTIGEGRGNYQLAGFMKGGEFLAYLKDALGRQGIPQGFYNIHNHYNMNTL